MSLIVILTMMKMRKRILTKVYIVRFGEYSDQGIAAVFSSEEKAKRYCDINNELDGIYVNYWIDDRILDEEEVSSDAKVVTYYCACISLNDNEWNKAGQIYFEDEYKQVYTSPVIIEKNDSYASVESTTSLEHAKKVAIEQYQIYTQQKLEEKIMENK